MGGPHSGETRKVPANALGWPPPINLPGNFHGGYYMRVEFSERPKREAKYVWMDEGPR